MADDTLQRTLVLAQKFVDETKADSEARAAQLIAEADAKARPMTESAQSQAGQIAAESEQRLREEISRLEDSRGRLTHEVETMSRHLESERNRLRTALGDILRWVDQNVQPTPTQDGPRSEADPEPAAEATPGPDPSPAPAPAPASVIQGGNRSGGRRSPGRAGPPHQRHGADRRGYRGASHRGHDPAGQHQRLAASVAATPSLRLAAGGEAVRPPGPSCD